MRVLAHERPAGPREGPAPLRPSRPPHLVEATLALRGCRLCGEALDRGVPPRATPGCDDRAGRGGGDAQAARDSDELATIQCLAASPADGKHPFHPQGRGRLPPG